VTGRIGRLVVWLALASVSVACAPGETTTVVLENSTDVPVAIHVDGSWVGTYPAATARDIQVAGQPPHTVEVFTPSGARLAAWTYTSELARDGGMSTSEVPCGIIRLSVGRIELPALGPVTPTGPCP
jgi:hypothetical protein